jgi:hypothetical protein
LVEEESMVSRLGVLAAVVFLVASVIGSVSRSGVALVAARTAPALVDHSLAAVACPAATFCVAVGASTDAGDTEEATHVVVGYGASWTTAATPNPAKSSAGLNAVSCYTKAFCLAVGDEGPTSDATSEAFSEEMGPKGWAIVPAPRLGDQASFTGVSCRAADWCVAVGWVGSNSHPVAELWNGTSWKDLDAPAPKAPAGSPSLLTSVSCTSETSCVAVGYVVIAGGDGLPEPSAIAESYDGHTWSGVSLPASGYISDLLSVSCPATSSKLWCVATGSDTSHTHPELPLVEVDSGGVWTITANVPEPQGTAPSFASVSCPAVGFCRVVGNAGYKDPIAATLSKGLWALNALPAASTLHELAAVSCASAGACAAVGGSDTVPPVTERDLEAWNSGKGWVYEH